MMNRGSISEISKERKKKFFFWFSMYLLGFIMLAFIGDSLQESSERVNTILGFIAPALLLASVIGMAYAMLKK